MSSTTKTKNYLLALLLSLLTLSVWSCERTPLPEIDSVAQPNPQLEEVGDCPIGLLRSFVLDQHFDAKYTIEIPPLPSYSLIKDCLCQMQYIKAEFNALPDAQFISVTDQYNVPVPFTGPVAVPGLTPTSPPAYEYIRIDTDDPHLVLHIEIDPAGGVESELDRAGGFCLVDNLSGPREDGQTIFNKPYVQVDPLTYRISTWVPTSITSAP